MAQPPILPFLSQAAYADRRALPRAELLPAGRVETGPPHVLPARPPRGWGDAASVADTGQLAAPALRLSGR